MTVVLIAAFLYLAAAATLMIQLRRGHGHAGIWLLPLAAVALHATSHAVAWHRIGGADLHFFSALSLVALGMAMLTTLYGAGGRMRALGIVVYPIAAAAMLGYATQDH